MLWLEHIPRSTMTAGFLDEQIVATGGVLGHMAYSSDGAGTWLQTNGIADCRYGMDIVSPQVIWSCGGATNVRKSVDGGKAWTSESVPVLPGPVYLSREGGFLTVITAYDQLTLLRYEE